MNHKFSRILGNCLIVLALIGLCYTLFPLILLQLPSQTPAQPLPSDTEFGITIPSISAVSPVIAQVDPNNSTEYLEALKSGVAHAKGTALPGESGTIYLFAHSSAAPWQLTHTNQAFFRLHKLRPGDQISLTYGGNTYEYQVETTKTVWPNEVSYLLKGTQTQLILQTCTPLGTSLKRLLVFAKPKF